MRGRLFLNRKDAGEQLGEMLEPEYGGGNGLVFGIPRGGVEVAYYVAERLKLPLSLIVSKKLPYPGHEEFGFGAIAEDYWVYIPEKNAAILPQQTINAIVEKQKKEIDRRVWKYRQGESIPDMKNHTVILVDDGIATGVTLVPVIRLCRKKGAAKIVIAAPVSGLTFDRGIHEADEIRVLQQPEEFYAVGQVYMEFGDFTDDEVIELLEKPKQTL